MGNNNNIYNINIKGINNKLNYFTNSFNDYLVNSNSVYSIINNLNLNPIINFIVNSNVNIYNAPLLANPAFPEAIIIF